MKILVIAEHDNISLKSTCHACICAAKIMASHLQQANIQDNIIDLLIAGSFQKNNINKIYQELVNLKILDNILSSNNEIFAHELAENLADLIANIARDYDYVIFPASTYGKNIAPRVAALLDINPLTDVIEILNQDTFKRPIYAGNAIATVRLNDNIKLFTIRPTSFEQELQPENNKTTSIIEIDNNKVQNKSYSEFVEHQLSVSERPELSTARIVVSGGRALGSKENFQLIDQLADKLNAAVGASRAAVDAGYVSNDYQVGQTGKVVAPDLYMAVGISGAIQHIAGIRDSKIIVAINKDAEAPIFKIADYGLVGDLFELVPELTRKITELRK